MYLESIYAPTLVLTLRISPVTCQDGRVGPHVLRRGGVPAADGGCRDARGGSFIQTMTIDSEIYIKASSLESHLNSKPALRNSVFGLSGMYPFYR